MKSFLSLLLCGLTCVLSAYDFPVPPQFLSDLGGAQAIRRTFSNAAQAVKSGDDGSFAFTYNTKDNKYAGISIILKQPLTIKPGEALLFDVRSTQAPGGIYCRLYQQGSRKPVWGFFNWKRVAGKEWITLTAQQGGSPDLLWEDKGVDLTAKPEKIARIEIIIGDHTKEIADFSIELRNFRIGKATPKVTELDRPATLSRQTDLTGKVHHHALEHGEHTHHEDAGIGDGCGGRRQQDAHEGALLEAGGDEAGNKAGGHALEDADGYREQRIVGHHHIGQQTQTAL